MTSYRMSIIQQWPKWNSGGWAFCYHIQEKAHTKYSNTVPSNIRIITIWIRKYKQIDQEIFPYLKYWAQINIRNKPWCLFVSSNINGRGNTRFSHVLYPYIYTHMFIITQHSRDILWINSMFIFCIYQRSLYMIFQCVTRRRYLAWLNNHISHIL